MTDFTPLVVGLIPLGLLVLASFQRSFRLVLVSIFKDGNSSTVISRRHDDREGAARLVAPVRRSNKDFASTNERIRGALVTALARREVMEEAMAKEVWSQRAMVYSMLTSALADAKLADEDLVITIDGTRIEVAETDPSHAGKHMRGN